MKMLRFSENTVLRNIHFTYRTDSILKLLFCELIECDLPSLWEELLPSSGEMATLVTSTWPTLLFHSLQIENASSTNTTISTIYYKPPTTPLYPESVTLSLIVVVNLLTTEEGMGVFWLKDWLE